MNYIRLKNIRSFVDTGKIELAPLTVLLGKNSSGKSTFLRMFPLFKQSWNNKNVGALALYGDCVDFGDFDSIMTTDAKSKFIGIEFNIEIGPNGRYAYILSDSDNKKTINCTCELEIKELKKSNILYCSYIKLTLSKNTVEIKVEDDAKTIKINVNGDDYSKITKVIHINYNNTSICFPSFFADENDSHRVFFPYQLSFLIPLENRLGHELESKLETYRL